MRYLTPLFVLLLCTGVRAQNTRIDTLSSSEEKSLYRYVTIIPGQGDLSKAELFMRGIKEGELPLMSYDRVDSMILVNHLAGERVDVSVPRNQRKQEVSGPFFDQRVIQISGRIGDEFRHATEVKNWRETDVVLNRTDREQGLKTDVQSITLPGEGSGNIRTTGQLPRGSETRMLKFADDGDHLLQVRFALIGFDVNEQDFVASKAGAAADPWVVPAGRETLYLRLRSTEKLMTVYKEGKVYSQVAVGHQLDEVNLSGLGRGNYLLEVTELGTGRKRYHGLQR